MQQSRIARFDGWELRLDIGELSKDGRKLRLQDQPLQILLELLEHPGELVTREQLIARLWPKGVVDFDTGLNSAVRKLRVALQDEAETPRYIETVPRKGYRFIGTIEAPAGGPPLAEAPAVAASPVNPPRRRGTRYIYIGALALIVVVGLIVTWLSRHPSIARLPALVAPGPRTIAVLPLRTTGIDEAGVLVAQSITDIIRSRLAGLKGLTVLAASSTAVPEDSSGGDTRTLGHKLHARFLLQGGAERIRERVQVDVQLIEADSGRQIWSASLTRPLSDIASLRDEVVGNVASRLGVEEAPEQSGAGVSTRISLDAYQVYIRGQRLLASAAPDDARQAVELFRRATILDQGFARAYLALGQALRLQGDPTRPPPPEIETQMNQAFARALELNPALGEAWVERARLARDPAQAEALFRKGLALAPNYGTGYAQYANFLWGQARAGEAIGTIDRAIQIDPMAPELYLRQAFFVMVLRSDVAEHDRLVREALALNPGSPAALYQLANSRYEYSGEFADAGQLVEHLLAAEPQAMRARLLARDIYLELGDFQAAAAVLGDVPPQARVPLAQFRGDRRGAAALLRNVPTDDWEDGGPGATDAEALRDAAIATGNFAPAVEILESAYALRDGGLPMWRRGLALVYAHLLTLAGEVERGRQLAQSTLVLLDSHSVGRVPDWFSRERAAAYAVLGDDERALEQLAISVRTHKLYRWWYVAERDPLYEHLRSHPQFKALNEQARQHLDRQRALFAKMRRPPAVPSSPQDASLRNAAP
jgi:DNA-binding winged helix-turn-helix (wHTH) protein/TolB-like protein/Tfp pilus assembly protein PilF